MPKESQRRKSAAPPPPPQAQGNSDDAVWEDLLKEVLRQEGTYLDAIKSLTDRASRLMTLVWAVFAFLGSTGVFKSMSPERLAERPLVGCLCGLSLLCLGLGILPLARVSLFSLSTVAGTEPELLVSTFSTKGRPALRRELTLAAKERVLDLDSKSKTLAKYHTRGTVLGLLAIGLLILSFLSEAFLG